MFAVPTHHRQFVFLALLAACFGLGRVSQAQPSVQVKYKSSTLKTYDISFNRQFPGSSFEYYGSFNTATEANTAIAELKRLDASMSPTNEWRLKVILVETNIYGAGTTTTKRPTKDYMDQIAAAYRRARDLKATATSMTSRLTQQQFSQVNQVIASYNSKLQQASSTYGGQYFSSYPMISKLSWYYVLSYNGQSYTRGPFSSQSSMVSDYHYLRRSYPTIRVTSYYAR